MRNIWALFFLPRRSFCIEIIVLKDFHFISGVNTLYLWKNWHLSVPLMNIHISVEYEVKEGSVEYLKSEKQFSQFSQPLWGMKWLLKAIFDNLTFQVQTKLLSSGQIFGN